MYIDLVSYGSHISIDMSMEPWEVDELLENIEPKVREIIPNIRFEVKAYRTYEEEYGGFVNHGVLEFDIDGLTKDEIVFIKNMIF